MRWCVMRISEVLVFPENVHRFRRNGEDKHRWQPANAGLPGKWPVSWCVYFWTIDGRCADDLIMSTEIISNYLIMSTGTVSNRHHYRWSQHSLSNEWRGCFWVLIIKWVLWPSLMMLAGCEQGYQGRRPVEAQDALLRGYLLKLTNSFMNPLVCIFISLLVCTAIMNPLVCIFIMSFVGWDRYQHMQPSPWLDYGIDTVDKCLGPTTPKWPTKDFCKIFWTHVSQSIRNVLCVVSTNLLIFALKHQLNVMTWHYSTVFDRLSH